MHYYQIESTGIKGFVTHEENEIAYVQNFLGDVWITDNTDWAARVEATEITKEQAQILVDIMIDEAILNWTPESGMPEPQPMIVP